MQINIISILLFIISPFLALPTILYGVVKKNKTSIVLFIILFSFLSYLFIPNYSDDKSRYIEMYEGYRDWGYIKFILYYLSISQDFILQTFIKIAAEIGVKPQIVFFTITSVVFSIIFMIWRKMSLILQFTQTQATVSLLLAVTSVSLLDLFSGTRFMLGAAVMLFAYFQGFIINKRWYPYIWLIIAVNIHFSLLVFMIIYLFVKIFNRYPVIVKIFFIISFCFLIIPKEFLSNILKTIGLGGALGAKGGSYTDSDDFLDNYFKEAGSAGLIIYFCQMLWIFMMYIYLFLHIKTTKYHHLMIFSVVAVMNIFFSTTTIYMRYSLFVKLIFVIVLFVDIKEYKLKKIPILFIIAFIIILITQFIIARYNIDKSYTKESFFLWDILNQRPVTSNDLIY
ncbi:EpsG family protein [Elizabethkingia anophelis]|uniref:EpsG family protein n=1 Tax=Elizabethkingia anophelis TaxID=1117645 RepID=UPI0016266EBD|nr:EpsG family protein [Elizabethkingia anophelis]WGL70753.1 EpsG family protein [Elizabethkingia anophelis]